MAKDRIAAISDRRAIAICRNRGLRRSSQHWTLIDVIGILRTAASSIPLTRASHEALQSSSVDVHGGDRFDSERTSEVGRPLMDATEIRQMVKYKQAVAIISNAPPVRLTYPKFARLENPPLSLRETRFRQAIKNKTEAKGTVVENVSLSNPIAGQITKPSAPPESKVDQWSEASKNNAADFEYDLAEIDEDYSPLFDDCFSGWKEPGL